MMIYIKDLEIRNIETKSGMKRFRFALFECPSCGNIVERKKGDGIKQKRCCGGKSKFAPKGSKLHNRYIGMTQRCWDKNAINYNLYGGRGIKVCKEWRNFDNFAEWALLNGFAEDRQLDRIDTNGDYCPENCRFVTAEENSRNKRGNIHTEDDIRKIKMLYVCTPMSIREIAISFGDSEGNISNILNGRTWRVSTEWDIYINAVAEAKKALPSKIRKMWADNSQSAKLSIKKGVKTEGGNVQVSVTIIDE